MKVRQFLFVIFSLGIAASDTGCNNAKKDKTRDGILFNQSVEYGELTDIEGNHYRTVTIGGRELMAENLRTTRYNNGKPVPLVTSDEDWAYRTKPAYCWYNNDKGFKKIYGGLYNWHAVSTGELCPDGWHVPTLEEWTSLMDTLGGFFEAGGKLKEHDTIHWNAPNFGATNETGFTALPAGFRDEHGPFDGKGMDGYWWAATQVDSLEGWYFYLYSNYNSAYLGTYLKCLGFSVRCVRDLK